MSEYTYMKSVWAFNMGFMLCMSLQRTFVGVDFFSVFQEVYLRTNDPRVSNIVRFSDAIGELKVEVWLLFLADVFTYVGELLKARVATCY